MLKPLNDYAQIKLDEQGTFSARAGDTATSGILIALPEHLTHYGFYSYAFDQSLAMSPLEPNPLDGLLDYWKQFIGKRCFWLALSEKGAILQDETGKYAFVKLTSLMAASEANELAESVLDKNNGSFAA